MTPDHFTHILLEKKILSNERMLTFQKQADRVKQTLFHYIAQHRLIDPETFAQHCANVFQLPYFALEINHHTFPIDSMPFSILKNHFILPIEKNENQLIIAIANPNDIDFCKKLLFQLNSSVQIVFSRYDSLCRLHNTLMCEQTYQHISTESDAQTLTHTILSDAIYREASDIHIEPYQHHLRVRFRIDGLLHEIILLPTQLTDTFISCLKVLAHLDIAIKRLPQDGRFSYRTALGFYKDCRVNTCPTQHGEKMVIRLLDTFTKINSISELGLIEADQQLILNKMAKPQGLILITGPTGSGKTITLYTLLNILNQSHRNISTIEDPIEIQLEGINQIPVNTKSGLHFSTALRALLRQDPDVMMIGEIRDTETADMAIRAAQTGHLVLSTLHTNGAAEAITRLSHMGISPFHLGSALTLVIAQRLVRRLCQYCKNEDGCVYCKNGFSGRAGIFELLPIQPEIKQMIFDERPHTVLAEKNRALGHVNLWESGMRCVDEGMTTMGELFRAIPE